MKPLIALVGRQNVGKSTLFNRLTRSSNALTANVAGLTRDRQYGFCTLGRLGFALVDTGGARIDKDDMAQQVEYQLEQAIDDAHVLLLLVDAREGLHSVDRELIARLRRVAKPWILVINKTEQLNADAVVAEFSLTGASMTAMVSATHGTGVGDLVRSVVRLIVPKSKVTAKSPVKAIMHDDSEQSIKNEDAQDAMPLAVIGRPGTGKSTLVNNLLGTQRVVVSEQMGTTRDSIHIPCTLFGHDYVLVDTAGVRRRRSSRSLIEKFSVSKTLGTLRMVPLVILLVDAEEGWVSQDTRLLGTILEEGCAVVIASNKWDLLDEHRAQETRAGIDRGIAFAGHVPCVEIVAKDSTGLKTLFKRLLPVYTAAAQHISTSLANKILANAIADRPPPMIAGGRVKLRYAHSGGNLPPVIVIHGSRAESVTRNYQQYLERVYREALGLTGVPIRLLFRNNENPYQDNA